MQTTLKKIKYQCGNAEQEAQEAILPLEILELIVQNTLEDEDWQPMLVKLLVTSRIFAPMVLKYFKNLLELLRHYTLREIKWHQSAFISNDGTFSPEAYKKRMRRQIKVELAGAKMLQLLGRRCSFATVVEQAGVYQVRLKCMLPRLYETRVNFSTLKAPRSDASSRAYLNELNHRISWSRDVAVSDMFEVFDAVLESSYVDDRKQGRKRLCANFCAMTQMVAIWDLNFHSNYLGAFRAWLGRKGLRYERIELVMREVYQSLLYLVPRHQRNDHQNEPQRIESLINETPLFSTDLQYSKLFRNSLKQMGVHLESVMRQFEEYAMQESPSDTH
jgi:hypothetical protein